MNNEKYCEYALAATNIIKKYGTVTVLHGMEFLLKKGEIHALLGANGAGKSTMLKVIDGVITDYEGQLYINGEEVKFDGPSDAQKKGIGMVHQELTVLGNITVAENIFLNRLPKTKIGTVDWKKLNQDAEEILNSIGLKIDPRTPLEKLTVADMQIVEIARILSMNVPIILLDEPTTALSEAEIRRLLGLMKKLKEDGKSIVFITHKLDEILEVSDRVTVMRDGCLVDTIEVTDRTPAGQQTLVAMMIGDKAGNMADMFPEKGKDFGETILEVKNLTKEGVFENISFDVKRKEVVVFTGLMGAKRTEVMRCLFGADPFTSGEIYFKGSRMEKPSIRKSIRNHIGMVTEDRKGEGIVALMSIKQNISLSTIEDCSKAGIMIGRKIDEKAKKFIDKLSIKVSSANLPVSSLSGGNQQKVVLSKWMAAEPELLILDEPTKGIDIGAKREIYKLVRKMADEGTAVIVVSSEIPEVLGLADRVYVMSEGKMMGELENHEMSNNIIMNLMFQQNTEEKTK
ncbi:MAG: sugar ABC transporter ATP-binding protein [Christensenellaceae bacterium]|nr:sugar ABC transporter ATP-binding protein [Christensenellaceae bacterium]